MNIPGTKHQDISDNKLDLQHIKLVESEIFDKFDRLVHNLISENPFFTYLKSGLLNSTSANVFLMSFNELVKSFPPLIALGIFHAPSEKARTILAVNLYQECGEGDIQKTHYAIFRKFLNSIAFQPLSKSENKLAKKWRDGICDSINNSQNSLQAISILAAGEFLAQPALSTIFPALQSLYPYADNEYFTTHLDQEEEHVREITTLLADQIIEGGTLDDSIIGFDIGLQIWDCYFNDVYKCLAK